jgi:diacylglycerol O-acyltransferase / wax synthase
VSTVGSRIARLSSSDLSNLRLETLKTPFHFGGLAIAEAEPFLDASGDLRLEEIRTHIELRLARIPQFRRRIFFPGLLRGRALWVDDSAFDIRRHVLQTEIGPPGGEIELLEAAAGLYDALLDRSHPLWQLWFLTGLSHHRIGVLLKLHHAIADGMAAVAVMGSLFDLDPATPEPLTGSWSPSPVPGSWPLVKDNLSTRSSALGRAITAVLHPIRSFSALSAVLGELRMMLSRRSAAPRTSLNQAVRAGRHVRFVRLDLGVLKEVGHSAGAKVNDVVLDLVAGGLRHLLMQRGEAVAGVNLTGSVAVSLRPSTEAGNLGNQVGVLDVPLPVCEADPRHRLQLIAAATRRAKADQHPAVIQAGVGQLAATPIAQYFMAHQRMINVFTTNVAGPPVPVYLLGARILDVIPIVQIAGNVALAFCAFSYAGGLNLVVTADSTTFPDVDVLVAAMEQTWSELSSGA